MEKQLREGSVNAEWTCQLEEDGKGRGRKMAQCEKDAAAYSSNKETTPKEDVGIRMQCDKGARRRDGSVRNEGSHRTA